MIAIGSGVNVLALSGMLGHTSAKVTLDTYADLFDTDLDAVASALGVKLWRWRRDLNPRRDPGQSAETACNSLGFPRFVPKCAQNVPTAPARRRRWGTGSI
jgi:hypothetical protein